MYRPTIKREHWPVRHGDSSVRIGGVIPEVAKDIPDPNGWVWTLLCLLDGSRTVAQIVAELVDHFPDRSAADIRAEVDADLATLINAGYVEDAAEPPPEELTAAERERYSRGQALWRWMDLAPHRSSWDTQLRLRQARVVVIGVGGVGSHAALALALSGIGELHLVDHDVVELPNLNRQVLFVEDDIGKLKVEVAVDRLRRHNSDISITGQVLGVDGPDTLVGLVTRFDVLVLAADKPTAIWSWANQACFRSGTAWVHGGYHGPRVNVGIYRPGTGPCYDCAYAAKREQQARQQPRTSMPYRRPAVWQAANEVSAGIAGLLAAHAAMSLITNVPRIPVNREYSFSLITMAGGEAVALDSPWWGCPTCGSQARPA